MSVGWPGLWVQWVPYVCYADSSEICHCAQRKTDRSYSFSSALSWVSDFGQVTCYVLVPLHKIWIKCQRAHTYRIPGVVLHVKYQQHGNPDPPQHTMNVGYKDLLGTMGVAVQITRDSGCVYADYMGLWVCLCRLLGTMGVVMQITRDCGCGCANY